MTHRRNKKAHLIWPRKRPVKTKTPVKEAGKKERKNSVDFLLGTGNELKSCLVSFVHFVELYFFLWGGLHSLDIFLHPQCQQIKVFRVGFIYLSM